MIFHVMAQAVGKHFLASESEGLPSTHIHTGKENK